MSILIDLTSDQLEALEPLFDEAHAAVDWSKSEEGDNKGVIIAQIKGPDMNCGFVPHVFAKRIQAVLQEWVDSKEKKT